MEKYDIYYATVPFEDIEGSKDRPILVIAKIDDKVRSLKITSKPSTSEFQYKIIEWEKAGLSKESYICYSPYVDIKKESLGERIGRLQGSDILMFEMQLYKKL